jgi:hypothetical protein
MGGERSGVFVVSKIQGQIVALLCGFFSARPREEQIAEFQDSDFGGEPVEKLLERSSSCRVRLQRTPRGIPTMLSKNPRIFSHRKWRAFQDEHQVICRPVPRSWLESLAESEHGGRSWLQLVEKEKLALLDSIVGLYGIRGSL